MADVAAILRQTLQQLRAERARLERQITAVSGALTRLGDRSGGRGPGAAKKAGKAATRAKRTMGAAQRRAVSQRMKAYWAARRTARAK